MRKQFKIAHIHTDPKFIGDVNRYNHKFFDNYIIAIGDSILNRIPEGFNVYYFKQDSNSIQKIAEQAKEYDLVIFVNLTMYCRKILKLLPSNIFVMWRFFGHELYSQRLDLTLSNRTKRVAKGEYEVFEKKNLKDYLYFFRKTASRIRDLQQWSKKVNYIQLYSKEEHKFLKKHWIFIPKLFQLGMSSVLPELKPKKKFILLGNSRNVNNNHLDILDFLKTSKNRNPYQVKMFLNYGHKRNYFNAVVEEIKVIPQVNPVYDFLPRKEFNQIFEEASALVLNCYRQRALANIFAGIKMGCKIYLNKKNITKKWLKNEGFKIFSIEQFYHDYENNDLELSKELKDFNRKMLENYYKRHSKIDFQQRLIKILEQNS